MPSLTVWACCAMISNSSMTLSSNMRVSSACRSLLLWSPPEPAPQAATTSDTLAAVLVLSLLLQVYMALCCCRLLCCCCFSCDQGHTFRLNHDGTMCHNVGAVACMLCCLFLCAAFSHKCCSTVCCDLWRLLPLDASPIAHTIRWCVQRI